MISLICKILNSYAQETVECQLQEIEVLKNYESSGSMIITLQLDRNKNFWYGITQQCNHR